MRRYRQTILRDVLFFVLLITIIWLIASYYVSRERVFYSWDFAGYQISAINQVDNYLTSRQLPFRVALNSLGDDYNALYTLPIFPLMLLSGAPLQRSSYVLSLAIIYFIPFCLIIGAISQKLIPLHPRRVFWSAVFITALFPVAWLPTLRGYPDTGGALLIALAVWIYLLDASLRNIWQILLIGIIMACAVLFRRHFGYAVVAFLASLILMTILRFIVRRREMSDTSWWTLFLELTRIGLVMLICLGVMLTIGLPFVRHVFLDNVQAAIRSWEQPPGEVFRGYQIYFGSMAFFFASAGYLAGIVWGPINRSAAFFVLLLGTITWLLWIFIVRQINPHYTLHFTPAILLGIVAWIWFSITRLKSVWRVGSLLLVGLYLSANAVYWLAPQISSNIFGFQSFTGFLSRRTGPLKRVDYDEISQMAKDLWALSKHQYPIYVVDSSDNLNFDLLANADRQLFPGRQPLNVLVSPQVDSRDSYPLEALLRAEYIVLSRPIQLHLPLSEHGVIQSVYDIFIQNREIAGDFVRLPYTYHLQGNVESSIYKRQMPTTIAAAIRALAYMEAVVGQRPANQKDWIRLSNFSQVVDGQLVDLEGCSEALFAGESEPTSMSCLFLGSLPGEGQLTGVLQSAGCKQVNVQVALAEPNGQLTSIMENTYLETEPISLNTTFESHDQRYLLLSVAPVKEIPIETTCKIFFESLSIKSLEGGS